MLRAHREPEVWTTPYYPNNYHNNQFQLTLIQVDPGKRIALRIVDFELEASRWCLHDYVKLRDGWSISSPLIGKFCGKKEPWTYITSGNKLKIIFKSNGSITKKGVKAYYYAVE